MLQSFCCREVEEERKRENKSTLPSSFALCRHVFMRCTSYDGYGKRFQVTQAPAVKDMLTRRRAKLSTLCFFLFSFSFISFLSPFSACMLVCLWQSGRRDEISQCGLLTSHQRELPHSIGVNSGPHATHSEVCHSFNRHVNNESFETERKFRRIVTSSFDVLIKFIYVFAVSSDRDRTRATTRVPRVPL